MTHAEITQSRIRQARSATEPVAHLDVWKLVRLGVWVAFCVLLLVLA